MHMASTKPAALESRCGTVPASVDTPLPQTPTPTPPENGGATPQKFKIAFLNGLFVLAMVLAGGIGVYRLAMGDPVAVIDVLMAAAAALLWFLLRQNPGRVEGIASVGLGLAYVLFMAANVMLPPQGSRLSLFFLLSAAAFFLKGLRAGLGWLAAIIGGLVVARLTGVAGAGFLLADLGTTVLYLVALAGIFYHHETLKHEELGRQREAELRQQIRERMEHERQLERLAHYDPLTGVPNRVLLFDRLAQALGRAKREQGLLAVCFLDLDGFKPVNDSLGHAVGDRVLVEATRRIREAVRVDDTVARVGGDEFVVLLVGLEAAEECVVSLQRILERIAQPIHIDDHVLQLSASIGVALYPDDEEDGETLLHHADQAMYLAKLAGRNRFHLFDPASDRRARSHHQLLREIREGLGRDEFELYYQPKVNLATRQLAGAEALIRWNHPQRGLLLPGDFMRAVEGTVLEIELGDWVIATATSQLLHWRTEGFRILVGVNVSAYQFQAPGFVDKLRAQAQRYGAQPGERWLQVEVLETAALDDFVRISALIAECRALGIGFALDDFGAGYSSLTYLSHLDVDTLKIDQSFVRDMQIDKGDHAVVQGIIALARAFEMHCVAEGVESEAVHQALLQMGCEVGQGNGIGLPMSASALPAWRPDS